MAINLQQGLDLDSVDFIGCYTNKTNSILKISLQDALNNILLITKWGNYKYYKK